MSTALPLSTLVAVAGAGAMGAGIAQVAAAAGHPVRLYDAREGAAESAIAGLRAQFAKLADKGRMTPDAAQAAGARLVAVDRLDGFAGAGLVVEAIVEDLAAKQALFSALEGVVGEDCLFGSNTSSISITAIGRGLARPERLAGLHFFNPAPLMALVEVVSGLATLRAVADTLFETAAAWGKVPVHAKSTPGFIVNRVARPYYGEALRLAHEGAADCATIDAVLREAGGFRMGPFELMDMIGIDVNFAVTRSVWSAFFHDPRFAPSLLQQELADAGFLGRKSGRGFYDYRAGAVAPPPRTAPTQPMPEGAAVCGDSAAARALADRLALAKQPFARRPAAPDSRIAEVNAGSPDTAAVLYVTDGRTATARAAANGVPGTVLVDLALDYGKATRLAVAAAAQCPPAAFDAATGLLQAAGCAVSPLADVAGLAVMRSVAMLANEAADAVNQGVCSVAGADDAMRLGVNYPLGPLAWADRIGPASVREVLANLAAHYGEDRYRASPLLQRIVHAGGRFHD